MKALTDRAPEGPRLVTDPVPRRKPTRSITVDQTPEQPVRFRTRVEYEAVYFGRSEFYTGIATGDRVNVVVENQVYTSHEGPVRGGTVSIMIQSIEHQGAWLSLYDRIDQLADITPKLA